MGASRPLALANTKPGRGGRYRSIAKRVYERVGKAVEGEHVHRSNSRTLLVCKNWLITIPQTTWNWIATVDLTINSRTTPLQFQKFWRQFNGMTPNVTVYLEN